MKSLFGAALGLVIAFAAFDPHAFISQFETPAVAVLKSTLQSELATAERDQAARFDRSKATPIDAAIFQAAAVLHKSARAGYANVR